MPPPPLPPADVQAITPKDGATAGSQRYKLQVSDGVVSTNALLASQLRDKVDDGSVVRGTILEVTDTVCNVRNTPNSAAKK